MKHGLAKLLLFLSLSLAIVFNAQPALAYFGDSWSSWSLGNTDYYDYGDGWGTGYQLGNTYYYDDTYGWNGSSYSLGNTDYYDYNNYETGSTLWGSSYDLGRTTYYDFRDEDGNYSYGNSYSLGNTDYYDFGDSYFSCYWLGSTYYCN